MILSFSLRINKKHTFFPEKIIKSLWQMRDDWSDAEHDQFSDFLFSEYSKWGGILSVPHLKPKLHTIRADNKDRWKAGNKIHFVINNRTQNWMQFAPVVNCVSVEPIAIDPKTKSLFFYDGEFAVEASKSMIETIAINDGFESVDAFWDYFDAPFYGKIIHWTPLNYLKNFKAKGKAPALLSHQIKYA